MTADGTDGADKARPGKLRIRERKRVRGRIHNKIATTAKAQKRSTDKPLAAQVLSENGGMTKIDFTPKLMSRGVPNAVKDTVLTDKDGMVEVPTVPDAPTPGQTKGEWEEQKVAQVEKLLLQGVREPALIQHYLNLSSRAQADTFIRRVKARWEVVGGTGNTRQDRGEMLAHIELLTNRIWSDYQAAATLQERAYLATLMMRLIDQRMTLYGLTETSIRQVLIVTEDSEVMERIKKQTKMAEFAALLAEKIARRRREMEDQNTITVDSETTRDKE